MSTSKKIEVRNQIPFAQGNVEVRSLPKKNHLRIWIRKEKNPKTEGANGRKHKSSKISGPNE